MAKRPKPASAPRAAQAADATVSVAGTILRVIGTGGFSTVFEAQRDVEGVARGGDPQFGFGHRQRFPGVGIDDPGQDRANVLYRGSHDERSGENSRNQKHSGFPWKSDD